MNLLHRYALALVALVALLTLATAAPAAPAESMAAEAPPESSGTETVSEESPEPDAEAEAEDKGPGQGDFDAGGQVRLPNGPDKMGEFATFNWIALDLVGRYFLLDFLTVNGFAPVAVIKPGMLPTGEKPKLFGGIDVSLEAALPQMPFETYKTDLTLVLSGAYMRERAMLLSKRDFPLFLGGFEPGFTAGTKVRIQLSSLFDFSTEPMFVYQNATGGSLTAVQIPTSTVIKLGELVKVSADLGVFTGDDYSFRGGDGARISAGGSLTVKIGPILAHAGAGVASLLTGGFYPTISDSVYMDLNVKYAK